MKEGDRLKSDARFMSSMDEAPMNCRTRREGAGPHEVRRPGGRVVLIYHRARTLARRAVRPVERAKKSRDLLADSQRVLCHSHTVSRGEQADIRARAHKKHTSSQSRAHAKKAPSLWRARARVRERALTPTHTKGDGASIARLMATLEQVMSRAAAGRRRRVGVPERAFRPSPRPYGAPPRPAQRGRWGHARRFQR